MRAIVDEGNGVVSLNYMWLPTFVGMNAMLKQQMEKDLQAELRGVQLDDKGLDRAHELVIDFVVKKFPDIKGLDLYLDAMKYLEP
jgi:hypothetical protein